MNALRLSRLNLEHIEERCQPSSVPTATFQPIAHALPPHNQFVELEVPGTIDEVLRTPQFQEASHQGRLQLFPHGEEALILMGPMVFEVTPPYHNPPPDSTVQFTDVVIPSQPSRLLAAQPLKPTHPTTNGIATLNDTDSSSEIVATDAGTARLVTTGRNDFAALANPFAPGNAGVQFPTPSPFFIVAVVDHGNTGTDASRPDRVVESPGEKETPVPMPMPVVFPGEPSTPNAEQNRLNPRLSITNGVPLMGVIPVSYDALRQSGQQLLQQLEQATTEENGMSTLEEFAWLTGTALAVGSATYAVRIQNRTRQNRRTALIAGSDSSLWEPGHD